MRYKSLSGKLPSVSFREAVVTGIAPNRSLYFPEFIPNLSDKILADLDRLSNVEIAFELIKKFVGQDIPKPKLMSILEKTLSFDFPLVKIEEQIDCLELFHGPSLAFKDVGAGFMARCLGVFNEAETRDTVVLVATSGDTGGAVAAGFFKVPGVRVVILYPSGKVSKVQEQQLTTFGENVTALEVGGVFDDCQEMVKTAFLDQEINNVLNLTSANSINVARWLPQMFYYAFALKTMKKAKKEAVYFSVPSGNFGNICAGIVAQRMGLPISGFIASTNINDTVPQFLKTGNYAPKPSKATLSNAMDVGNPSNFVRIEALYGSNFKDQNFYSYSFTDQQTTENIGSLYQNHAYIADPHGAIAYAGAKQFLAEHGRHSRVVFLETAHPSKFKDTVENVLGINLDLPNQLKPIVSKPQKKTKISSYDDFKAFLLS